MAERYATTPTIVMILSIYTLLAEITHSATTMMMIAYSNPKNETTIMKERMASDW
jgi:hypothetical protein